jgi:hypothetical protein
MKFTKAEEQILSPKHEKYEKVILWLGICCLCLSIALIPYEIDRINKLQIEFGRSEDLVEQQINSETQNEKTLHSIIQKSMAINTDLWRLYESQIAFSRVFPIFLFGCFFLCHMC